MKKTIAMAVVIGLSLNTIAFANAQPQVICNGIPLKLELPIINKNDTNFYPLRELVEGIGGEITWNPDNGLATVTRKGKTLLVYDKESPYGLEHYSYGDIAFAEYKTASLSFVSNDYKYVPIRYVADELGLDVKFDNDSVILTEKVPRVAVNNPTPVVTNTQSNPVVEVPEVPVKETEVIALTRDKTYRTLGGLYYTDSSRKKQLYIDIDGLFKPKDQLLGIVDVYSINLEEVEDEIIRLINEEREESGLNTLIKCETLTRVAKIRSIELNESFSHDRPNGKDNSTVLEEYNIDHIGFGENIGGASDGSFSNSKDAAYVAHNQFKDSQGHHENYMRSGINEIAIGASVSSPITRNGVEYRAIYICELFSY